MNRRKFLIHASKRLGAFSAPVVFPHCVVPSFSMAQESLSNTAPPNTKSTEDGIETISPRTQITLFLCGDVMTGRGIDQILPYPSDPRIHESYMRSSIGYVELTERVLGPLPRGASFEYIWGDALKEFEKVKPDVRIINLETAVTNSNDYWKWKGINYRMHPNNIPCITAANIDCCILANNHVLDWGYSGLEETLQTLKQAYIKTAGAGCDIRTAKTPAILKVPSKGRVLVYALGSPTSGIPYRWAATKCKAGVNFLADLTSKRVDQLADSIQLNKRRGDLVVASIHWGGNWGFAVPEEQQTFAHQLIDEASVDVIHGHSSHHPKGLEVYRGKPIIYGCGDFLNDYEGISGHEAYRGELGLMYFVSFDPDNASLIRFKLTPTRIKGFRINYATTKESHWLADALNREGKYFGTEVTLHRDNTLTVKWQ